MNIFINVLCLAAVFLIGYMIGFPDGERCARKKVKGAELRAMEKGGHPLQGQMRDPRNPGDGFEGPHTRISTAPTPGRQKAAKMVLLLIQVWQRKGWPYHPPERGNEERSQIEGGVIDIKSDLEDMILQETADIG